MTSDEKKSPEERGYNRGYTAGVRDARDGLYVFERKLSDDVQRRRDQFFCAALQGVIALGGGTINGKKVERVQEILDIAWTFADEAMKGPGG